MARGGYRPGAGRPKLTEAEKAERKALKGAPAPAKKAAKKRRTNPHLDLPLDVAGEAAMANMSPLDYMLYVMRNGAVESARRDRMAIAAAPFMHARKEAAGPGKRESADMAAKSAGSKFKTGSAPLKLVGKG